MARGEYRKDRVSMTIDISKEISRLLEKNKDYQKKKKQKAEWYRDKVALNLKLAESQNPSIRTYEGEIRELKNIHKKPRPLDAPWSFATLTLFPIPQNKLPFVLTAAALYDETIREHPTIGHRLTIRQALWISRLAAVPLATALDNNEKAEDYYLRLITTSAFYSVYEMSSELVGIVPADTGILDAPTFEEIETNTLKYFKETPEDDLLHVLLHERKEKLIRGHKWKAEYISMPNATEYQVGDIVQLKETKEIVKIMKIDDGAYFVETAPPSVKKMWEKMIEKGKR